MENEVIRNIDRIHTTEMGAERIRRNLKLNDRDVVQWCKAIILDTSSVMEKRGKTGM